jgi:hypothetical protein
MTVLDKLDRRFGRFAIPNLTLILIVGQVTAFGFMLVGQLEVIRIALIPAAVLEGEVWRVLTFLFVPPNLHPILLAFFWYIFFLMGSSLEQTWGAFRYNLYIAIAWVATLATSFLVPESVATNAFLKGSVFLAFAFLNPNFELLLFFILPVKVKWLALLTWLFYALNLVVGTWPIRLAVLASISNFLLFFGRDVVELIRTRQRRVAFETQRAEEAKEPFHRCHTCGRTDRSDPGLEFRYCSQCEGDYCYCEEHLRHHEHVREPENPN